MHAVSVLKRSTSGVLMAPHLQELNDRRLTLVEGSALSERDLVRTRAHSGSAILLLADRFSPSSHQEDLGLQFQVRLKMVCLSSIAGCGLALLKVGTRAVSLVFLPPCTA